MSVLYIGNTTKKRQYFLYRLPEDVRPSPLQMQIAPGGQAMLPSKDLSPQDIEAIVAPHRPYGLIPVAEIDRTKPFIGMFYSIDRPGPLEAIQKGLAHNDHLLDELGKKIRQAGAIALNNHIEAETGGLLNALEMEVVEIDPDKHQGEGDAIGGETITVTRETDPTKPVFKRGPGRPRKDS